ncbi:hypothetical protein HAALTHF_11840n [Vreelandella aquamarina]|nr:hypothetical protein HAALTHF_11840n [Halomonas axialensis]
MSWTTQGTLLTARMPEFAVATAMVLLGLQKLQDIESFSTMFLNYDLLAQRYVPYSYVYPYAETAAGLLMLAGTLIWVAAPLALFVGTVGAVSVFKAVYIDKRELARLRGWQQQRTARLCVAHRKPGDDRHGPVDAAAHATGLASIKSGLAAP